MGKTGSKLAYGVKSAEVHAVGCHQVRAKEARPRPFAVESADRNEVKRVSDGTRIRVAGQVDVLKLDPSVNPSSISLIWSISALDNDAFTAFLDRFVLSFFN